ncbi:Rho GDP-dissociation inhibitor [Fusarium oxysporum f. sp. albedinis]|nr:Rho GDP-dissociation inhibitor [Fusarium oxysporum f. sp. albedinis]
MLEVRHQVVPGRRRNVSGESGVASAGQPESRAVAVIFPVIAPPTDTGDVRPGDASLTTAPHLDEAPTSNVNVDRPRRAPCSPSTSTFVLFLVN